MTYFAGKSDPFGVDLWQTDETNAGTSLVRRINITGDTSPRDFVRVGEIIYFTADDGANGRQLWRIVPISTSVLRILTTSDKPETGYAWVLFADGNKQWVDAACRARLIVSGLGVDVLAWNDIASYPDTETSRSCEELLGFAATFPRIVTTIDKPRIGYAWVLFADGTKQWINPTCRVTLDASSVDTEVLDWVDIAAFPDRSPVPCYLIPAYQPENNPVRPRILTTVDKPAQGYAWVLLRDDSKQWINAECRAQLVDSGLETDIRNWDDISSYPDVVETVGCTDILNRR